MGNVGCNASAEVAILTLASLFGGCASSGPIVNSVDLAPNFSGKNFSNVMIILLIKKIVTLGSILGLISIASMSAGFLVPLMVSNIIKDNVRISQSWQTELKKNIWFAAINGAVALRFHDCVHPQRSLHHSFYSFRQRRGAAVEQPQEKGASRRRRERWRWHFGSWRAAQIDSVTRSAFNAVRLRDFAFQKYRCHLLKMLSVFEHFTLFDPIGDEK